MSRAGASNMQRAVARLRAMIFDGRLGPGSDHLETEVAAELGMSRTPVREAVLLLEAQGLVEVRPRRGFRVCAISPRDMSDVYDVLTELESLAAQKAAERGYETTQLAALSSTIDDMEAALGSEDREAWAEADARFHRELLRLGGNGRIERIAEMMEDQVRRAKSVTLHMRPLPVKSNADHRAVLDAIAAGKAHEARLRHQAHRRAARDLLVGLLELHRLRLV